MKTIIAIDGPAASGKSSVGSRVAEKLGGVFVSTGSLYRLIALALWRAGINAGNQDAVAGYLPQISLEYVAGDWQMNGKFFDDELREPEIGGMASVIATQPEVRKFLLEVQRRQAAGSGLLVMEGRDIGTVIFPEAQVKVFLTASPEERARRRLKQEGRAYTAEELAAMSQAIAERDRRDSERLIAPLAAAIDAVTVDSSNWELAETVDTICRLAAKKLSLENRA